MGETLCCRLGVAGGDIVYSISPSTAGYSAGLYVRYVCKGCSDLFVKSDVVVVAGVSITVQDKFHQELGPKI